MHSIFSFVPLAMMVTYRVMSFSEYLQNMSIMELDMVDAVASLVSYDKICANIPLLICELVCLSLSLSLTGLCAPQA